VLQAVDPCYNYTLAAICELSHGCPPRGLISLATESSASNLSLKRVPPSGYLRLEKMGLQFSTRLRPFARAWAIDRLVLD